jgi:hypothetical protein
VTTDTYAGIPVRRGINFEDVQRSAENLLAFQDAVQEALRTEDAGNVLDAIEWWRGEIANARWHRAVLRRHLAEHGLDDPTWASLSEDEKAALRATDAELLASLARRLPTGTVAA